MNGITYYVAGHGAAMQRAEQYLLERGCSIADLPSSKITHLLLPVPSFDDAGYIRGGEDLDSLLSQLPESVTVMGGNLTHPALEGKRTKDFLQDELYLAENAAITADCALRIAGNHLPVVFEKCPILVLGWGRIGKCLAAKLKALGADVSVAARKQSDRAMLQALGYRAEDTQALSHSLLRYRVIFNTAPATVLSEDQCRYCRSDCVKIDLASKPGITDSNVIRARGLPGKDAPESSGSLIGKTAVRLASERGSAL